MIPETEKPNLERLARISIERTIAECNDPKGELCWDDIQKWQRHAMNAVLDLQAAEKKIEEQERELVRLREGWVSDMWWDAYDPDRPHYSAREAVVAHYGTNEIVEFQCAKRMPTMFGYITDATEDADEDAKLFDTLAEAEAALKMEKHGVPVVDVPKVGE